MYRQVPSTPAVCYRRLCLWGQDISHAPRGSSVFRRLLCRVKSPSTAEALQCKVSLGLSGCFPPCWAAAAQLPLCPPSEISRYHPSIYIYIYIYIYGFLHCSHILPHCSVPYSWRCNASVEIVCISTELSFVLSNGRIQLHYIDTYSCII